MKILWWLFGWTFRDWHFWRQYEVTSFTLSAVGALHPGVVILMRQKAREIWLPAAAQPQELMEVRRLLDSKLIVPRRTHGKFDMGKLQASAPRQARLGAPSSALALAEVGPNSIRELMQSENLTDADTEKFPESDLGHEIEFLPTKPAA